jgi:polysaccharide biosynthesis protein PslH
MKAIVLIADRAYPALSGSKVRNLHLWPEVKKLGVEVRVLGLDLTSEQPGRPQPLIPGMDAEAFRHQREILPRRLLNAVRYSYHQWPFSHALAARVDELVAEWRPDIVHAEELKMAAYLPALRGKKGPRQTVTFHNMESDLLRRTGSSGYDFGRPLVEACHRANLEAFEANVIASVNLCLAYSPVDRKRYQEKYQVGNWAETRGGVKIVEGSAEYQPQSRNALLAGSLGYLPNVEGLYWFLDKIRPLLAPDLKLTVAGSRASEEARRRIQAAGISFLDTPPDLVPLYHEHAISLVPLLSGSGTRGRILESLGNGRAVVTTTIGAEGLELPAGLRIADSPEAFAEAVKELVGAPNERLAMAKAGYERVKNFYAWPVVARELLQSWESG